MKNPSIKVYNRVQLSMKSNHYFVPRTWLLIIKLINALQQMKATYKRILRCRLDVLEQDYAILRIQSQELAVQNCKEQRQMNMAA